MDAHAAAKSHVLCTATCIIRPPADERLLRHGPQLLDMPGSANAADLFATLGRGQAPGHEALWGFLADTLGVSTAEAALTRISGEGNKGLTDAGVFFATGRAGQQTAVVKFTPQAWHFAGEYVSRQRLDREVLMLAKTPRTLGTAQIRVRGGMAIGVTVSTVASGQSINDMFLQVRDADIARRPTAFSILRVSVEDLGRAMAELHTRPEGTGQHDPRPFIDFYQAITQDQLRAVEDNSGFYRPLGMPLEALRTRILDLSAATMRDPGASGLVHGDADPGNFFYEATERRITLIDLPSMHRSLGPAGELVGSPARDVGNFHRLIAFYAERFGLAPSEAAVLQSDFLDGYRRGGGADIPEHAFEFFRVHSAMYQVAALPHLDLAPTHSGDYVDLSERVERLRQELGLAAPTHVVPAVAASTAPQVKRPPVSQEQIQQVGAHISTLWQARATPAVIVEYLTTSLPHLLARFDTLAVPKERYTLSEHTQMVLGQYQTLTAGDTDVDRLVPIDTVVKTILFHDLDKLVSSQIHGAGTGRHDGAGEHVMAVQAIQEHRALFGSATDVRAAAAFIDADPFGYYLRGLHDADTVFAYCAGTSLRLTGRGLPEPDQLTAQDATMIVRLFDELHQYYQADVASYTSHSQYVPAGETEVHRGLPSLDWIFTIDDRGNLARDGNGAFQYSDTQGYRDRFAALADMFRDPQRIRSHYARIFAASTVVGLARTEALNAVERATSRDLGARLITNNSQVVVDRQARMDAVALLSKRMTADTRDLLTAVTSTHAGVARARQEMLWRLGDTAHVLVFTDGRYPALGGQVVPSTTLWAGHHGAVPPPHWTMDDPRLPLLVREIAVAEMVRAWSVSSNGNVRSLAIQEAAAEEFGLDPVLSWPMSATQRSLVAQAVRDHGPVLREFVRAQYTLAQESLDAHGVRDLVLYRGYHWPIDQRPGWSDAEPGTEADMPLQRPLTAWTTNRDVALEWLVSHAEPGVVIAARVPAEAVLTYPGRGVGCLWQDEFVLLAPTGRMVLDAVADDRGVRALPGDSPQERGLDTSDLERVRRLLSAMPASDRIQLMTAVGTARPVATALIHDLRQVANGRYVVVGEPGSTVRPLASLVEEYAQERRAVGLKVDQYLAEVPDLINIRIQAAGPTRPEDVTTLAHHLRAHALHTRGTAIDFTHPVGPSHGQRAGATELDLVVPASQAHAAADGRRSFSVAVVPHGALHPNRPATAVSPPQSLGTDLAQRVHAVGQAFAPLPAKPVTDRVVKPRPRSDGRPPPQQPDHSR